MNKSLFFCRGSKINALNKINNTVKTTSCCAFNNYDSKCPKRAITTSDNDFQI